MDDGTLWRNAQQGDAQAFGLLFERHADAIYNYCFRRIGNWATAEDLLVVVFMEAWRRRDKDLTRDKVLPWLYGIALNVVRNERRSRRRFAAALSRLPRPRAQHDEAPEVLDRLDDERQMTHLLGWLSQLPQIDQEILVLCAWCELSYEDASAALDVPIGTVRSRLSRARGRLRELAAADGHEQSDEEHQGQEAARP